jgi:hypothetical protein
VTDKYVLPPKIKGFLQRLHFDYVRQDATSLEKIIGRAKVYVRENTDPTRFSGGGAVLHDVVLFLPIKTINEISYEAGSLDSLRAKICSNLNSLASTIPNEEVRIVAIDVADESDDEFCQAQEIGINE